MPHAVDIGTWRSRLGDTWPHHRLDVERDWWPQSAHLVWEPAPLVVCVTGMGGGSQQAMFRRELDSLLAGALARWHERDACLGPRDDIAAMFAEIQRGFARLTVPYAAELQASAVGIVIEDDRGAIAHTGLEQAWRLRDGGLAQLTADDSLGAAMPGPRPRGTLLPTMFEVPASWLGANPTEHTWQLTDIEVGAGDLYVLMSGHADTGCHLRDLLTGERPVRTDGSAQHIADALGERALATTRDGSRRWRIGSRLAIAVVQMM